jgi:hypothetical protein
VERNWSTYGFIHLVKRNILRETKDEDLVYVHSNLLLLSHSSQEYKKGSSRMWDVEPEIFDLNMTLNAMTHLNVLEDVTLPVPTSVATSNNLAPPPFIHDVGLQYVDDEDVDPFQDL